MVKNPYINPNGSLNQDGTIRLNHFIKDVETHHREKGDYDDLTFDTASIQILGFGFAETDAPSKGHHFVPSYVLFQDGASGRTFHIQDGGISEIFC